MIGHRSLLLGEALDLLGDPAHGGAALLLLSQHGHHGLGKQVRMLPVAHHFLEKSWRECEVSRCSNAKRRAKGRWPCPLQEAVTVKGAFGRGSPKGRGSSHGKCLTQPPPSTPRPTENLQQTQEDFFQGFLLLHPKW